MKIAIIADALDYQYAGIFYYTQELIKALAKIDKKNEYWIIRSKSAGDISHNVKELVVPSRKIPGAAAFRLFFQIPNILKKMNMDIVIEPRHFGPFNLPKKIKRVTVIHDLSPLHYPQWHQFISRNLQQLFLPSILKKANHIITNSSFTALDVAKHFPNTASKTTGILLGKEDSFRPQTQLSILEKYDITKPYILHTGTIEPRKNLTLLLTAFELIKRKRQQPLQLVLIGKLGWKSKKTLNKINNSTFKTDIKMLGYLPRTDLPKIYSMATAFVYPSYFEGFGLPVVEAMACGIPVLVSNSSCLPEVVGDAGLYFDPSDVQTLTKHLTDILLSPMLRKNLSIKSLRQAQKFSWEKTAAQTLGVLQRIYNE